MTALTELAAFLVAPPPAYGAKEPLARATMALSDLIGVTLAGSAEPLADIMAGYHADSGEKGPCSLIGLSGTATPASAAFLNGTLGHALDYDDSNFVLGGHPSVVILPALLALAEARNLSGIAVLQAYVAGFEVMCRISAAVNMHHYEKGWHPTATLGVFGAAAASAHLLRLPQSKCVAALAMAAAAASGVKESFGSMAKPVQVGQAASRGVVAALLAERGLTAPVTNLDGPRGFFQVYNGSGNYDLAQLSIDPAQPELMRSGLKFKRYACCGSTHVAIDAARALREQDGFDAAAIDRVRLEINPRRRPHVDRPVIDDPLGAKFSLQFTVAAALLDGEVGLDHFTPAAIARPDIRALMARIEVGSLSEQAGLDQPCALEVTQANGRRHQYRLNGPQGRNVADYASYRDWKFADCASRALAPAGVERLRALLTDIEALPSVRPLMQATRPAQTDTTVRSGTHD